MRTIHYYVAEGVLPPPAGQRRSAVYPFAHLARLRLVALLRDEGLSLSAIRARVSALDDAQAQSIAAELQRLLAQEAEGISVLALFEAALTDLSAYPASDAAAASDTSRPAAAFSYRDERAERQRQRQPEARVLREGADDADQAHDGATELDSATEYVERLLAARRHAIRPQRPGVSPPRPGAPRPAPRPQPMPVPMPMPPQPQPQPQPPFGRPVAPPLSVALPRPVETWHTLALEDGIELRVRADRMHVESVSDATAHADAAARLQQALDALRAAITPPATTPTTPPVTSPTPADRSTRADST